MPRNLRVAAAQFATGTDLGENLATTLRMLRAAAEDGARLVVLPEFCNHLSIYDDAEHAWEVALTPEGEWVREVTALACELGVWTQLNVTLRRTPPTGSAPGVITNSNLVISPEGSVVTVSDKTVLMGAEGDHLTAARTPPAQTTSPWGVLGSYACMDGIVPEVPRVVAAGGARILMNSLNSFALDEASLHVPVRAAENRAWVVACCKVGPLLPPERLDALSQMIGIPPEALDGAGESQVVAPDGTVVAKGPRTGEAVVAADIDLDRAGQPRPDGTDPWAQRRPEIYAPLAAPTPARLEHPCAEEITVAALAPPADGIGDAVTAAVGEGASLVVLPELAVDESDLGDLSALLAGSDAVVVTSVRAPAPEEATSASEATPESLVGIVVGADGVLARQAQLHRTERHPWATGLGSQVVPIELPWGRLAVVVGDDLVYPEVARLAALQSVDVLAVPLSPLEAWETDLGVPERAAENRVCVVAASARGSAGPCVVADLAADHTLWATDRVKPFDGRINQPEVSTGEERVVARVHPDRARHRQISKGTDLVDGRPWEICAALVG